MPLYDYTDEATGITVQIKRRVEDRNKPIVLRRRKTVPDRVAVVGMGPNETQEFNRKMLGQYHRKEEREGSRFKSSFSKKQIQQTWS